MNEQQQHEIENVIAAIRDLHPDLERTCLHGSCFKLHELLAMLCPDAVPYVKSPRA